MSDIPPQTQMQLGQTRDWMPDTRMSLVLNLAAVVVSVITMIPFMALYGSTHDSQAGFEVAGWELLVAILVTLALTGAALVIHEWIHALVVKRTGGTPAYGAKLIGKIMPVFFVTSAGHRFTRKQFIAVALAPLAVLSVVFAVLIVAAPFGGWLVLPAALHTGGCVGDIVMAWKAWREQPGTLVEDRIEGLRFYLPA